MDRNRGWTRRVWRFECGLCLRLRGQSAKSGPPPATGRRACFLTKPPTASIPRGKQRVCAASFPGQGLPASSPPAPLSAPLGPGLRGRALENALILYARRLRFGFGLHVLRFTLEVGGSRFEWFVMAGLSKGLHQYLTSFLSPCKHAWVDEKAGQAQGLRGEEGGREAANRLSQGGGKRGM